VTSASARSWIFRYKLNSRARDMGLGSYPDVSLAEARGKAEECEELTFFDVHGSVIQP
jgi:hypothetical protein